MLSDARDGRIYLQDDPSIGVWLEIGVSLSFLERHDLDRALVEEVVVPLAAKAPRRSAVTLAFLRWACSRSAAWAGAVSDRRPLPCRAGAALSERACAGAPAP